MIGPFREPDRDPRQFAREVKRIAGERHPYYYGGDSFMAHLHWYVDTPTTMVRTQDELLRAVNEGSGYVLLPFAVLDTLRQRHALDGRAAVVATADLGKRYQVILLRGGGGATSPRPGATSH